MDDESFCHASYPVTSVCYNTLRTVKMKRFLVLTAVVLFAVLFVGMVQGRTWTDAKGKKVTADFVKLLQEDEPKVKLKTPTGKIIVVPVRNLSKEDQDYIKQLGSNNLIDAGSDNNRSYQASAPNNSDSEAVSESIVYPVVQDMDISSREAFKAILQLQERYPTRIEHEYTAALLLIFQKRDYFQAKQHFVHCHNKKPNDIGTLINMGTLYIIQKKYQDAFTYYQKAYMLDNSNKTLFHNLNKIIDLTKEHIINMPETAQKKFIDLTNEVSKKVNTPFNSKYGWVFEKCSEGLSQEPQKSSWFEIEGYRPYEFPICVYCEGEGRISQSNNNRSGGTSNSRNKSSNNSKNNVKSGSVCPICKGSGFEISKYEVASQLDEEKWKHEEQARREKWERDAKERELLAKEQEAKIQEAKKKEEQERKEEHEKDLKEYEYALKNRSVKVNDSMICAAKIQRVFQVYLENAYSGEISVSENGNYLIIDVAVFNNSTTKKINFESWAGDRLNMGSKARLKDEYDNTYKRIVFGAGTLIAGNKPNDSIYPGKAIMDRLVFETPIVKAKKLTLILPGENIESDKDIQIEFDVSEIRMSKLRD